MTAPADCGTPILRYGAMRLRWCVLALKAFLVRWGAYALVTGLVLGAGTAGWQQVLEAVAAALVLPLFSAASQGAWLVPATLAQAAIGAAAVWGARSLLWPHHWAESERALPLRRSEVLRSDLLVVLVVLAPLTALHAAGAVSVLVRQPAGLVPTQGRALAALVLADLLSIGLGAALLRRQREDRTGGAVVAGRERERGLPVVGSGILKPWRAVVLLPLSRGPARRTGRMLLAGSASLVLVTSLPSAFGWAAGWPWCLGAWAAIALLATTRIGHLARLELCGLLQACAGLPVDLRALRRTRSALGLVPLLPGFAGVTIGLRVAPPVGLRPAVLAAWAVACALACAVEVVAGTQPAADKAARWWFSLIVCACLASEVLS